MGSVPNSVERPYGGVGEGLKGTAGAAMGLPHGVHERGCGDGNGAGRVAFRERVWDVRCTTKVLGGWRLRTGVKPRCGPYSGGHDRP